MLTAESIFKIWEHESQWGEFDRRGFGREVPTVEEPAIPYRAQSRAKPKDTGTYRVPSLKRR